MKAYLRTSNLKRGLIVLAVLLAIGSLWYTSGLVERLRERERQGMEIWARAREEVTRIDERPPDREHVRQLLTQLDTDELSPELQAALDQILSRAALGYEDPHSNFFFDVITDYYRDVPAIITDSTGEPLSWHNLRVDASGSVSAEDSARVRQLVQRMADVYAPIVINAGPELEQKLYYDESSIIRELRMYPFLQLLFVGLFVLVGYLGFSYVRRNEQSSLWVGMAREAAHQLGTPLTSLMGWIEMLRSGGKEAARGAVEEIDQDVKRLSRVAQRFNDIGSTPRLTPQNVQKRVKATAAYMRRRMPRQGVVLTVDVEEALVAPLNAELFDWVIENLVKNALDALQPEGGTVGIVGKDSGETIVIDVTDDGRGIDRKQFKNVFRPGYSTKQRGWGLGLSLARRIIQEYHGGALTLVHSKVGKGTTFRILIPQSGE